MYDELIKALRNCSDPSTWCEDCVYYEKCCKNKEHFSVEEQAADAIEELQKDLERSKDFEAFWQHEAEEALKKFQVAISNKPRWIPVTERLPEDRQRVLAISLSKISPRSSCYRLVYFSNNLESVDNLEFEGESRCGFYYYDSEYGFCEVDDVTHWMPLPQPPKEET